MHTAIDPCRDIPGPVTQANNMSTNYNALPGPLLLAIVDKSMFKKAVSLFEENSQ
jgi:hypothetical protein